MATQADSRNVVWQPNPGPQTQLLSSGCTEIMYGGAAGGGKTDGLIATPLRFAHLPNYRGVIFRRTYPELQKSILERAQEIYPKAFPGTFYHEGKNSWIFPSGARVYCSHMQDAKSVHQHQSAQYQSALFDEATSFLRSQIVYITGSRMRSAHGIPIQIRYGTNPGNHGHAWVFQRFGPWLDPEFEEGDIAPRPLKDSFLPAMKSGEVLHVTRSSDGVEHFSRRAVWGPHELTGERVIKSVTRSFILAKLTDNPHLMKNDPEYGNRLDLLDPVTRAQLKDGNWLIKPGRGLYFNRSACRFVETLPKIVARVRYWDLAGTDDSTSDDPDYTVGVRMALTSDFDILIEDVVRFRKDPAEVERRIKATAEMDTWQVAVLVEQDPGQAGKFQVAHIQRQLPGFSVLPCVPSGDKLTRFKPFSAHAMGTRGVYLLRGEWNAEYIQELEAFPEGSHDDQCDATSGAFMQLMNRDNALTRMLIARVNQKAGK